MTNAMAKLKKQVEDLARELAALRVENKLQQQKIQMLLHRLFGRKSEKIDPAQMQLLFESISEAVRSPEAAASAEDGDDDPPTPPSGPRRGPRNRKDRLPADLPTETVVIEPEEVKRDPQAFVRIGEEVTEELDVVPARYLRRLIVRPKYKSAKNRGQAPVVAALPPRLVPGSILSPGLAAHMVVSKYVEHVPLHRLEQIFRARDGIILSRKRLSDWTAATADWLRPIHDGIRAQLRATGYLQVDETPVTYLRREGGGSGKGYFWVYHHPGQDVLFEWHTGRGAVCLEKMLDGFMGTVQCDAYGAYSSYAASRLGILLAGCWAHARRKVFEARDEERELARWLIRQIRHLYRVETALRRAGASHKERQRVRSVESAPVLARLEKALKLKLPKYLPRSQMGKAIGYILDNWARLTLYVQDGRLEIDNNWVENSIRGSAVGKKNWMFIGHPEAGDRSAILYTIVESCRRHGINPYEYLRDVLSRLPAMTYQQARQLTPRLWKAARAGQAA